MSLSDLAAIGSFISGLAVVITLPLKSAGLDEES